MPPAMLEISPITLLPGEIRNQIYELCILHSVAVCTNKNHQSSPPRNQHLVPFGRPRIVPARANGLKVSILPGWNGAPRIKTYGLGPLPILFVNKQIHSELSSLIDSRISEVTIGPYSVQYGDEDPNLRWKLAHSLTNNRPYLLRHVKTVNVLLPWLRKDLLKNYWKSLGHKWESNDSKCYGLMVIPDLIKFLKLFQSLSKLSITLVAENLVPPDMAPLLTLYDEFQSVITVNIVEPHAQGNVLPFTIPVVDVWVRLWANSLSKHRESVAVDDMRI